MLHPDEQSRGSAVLKRLARGEPLLSLGIRNARTAEIVRMAKTAGFAVAWIDLEHSSMSVDCAVQIVASAADLGMEAWVRVRGDTVSAKREARERFLTPLRDQLETTRAGHIPEIADAEPPHTPRGCPFQAWSVGEILRLEQIVLAEPKIKPARKAVRRFVNA